MNRSGLVGALTLPVERFRSQGRRRMVDLAWLRAVHLPVGMISLI